MPASQNGPLLLTYFANKVVTVTKFIRYLGNKHYAAKARISKARFILLTFFLLLFYFVKYLFLSYLFFICKICLIF